MITWFISTSTLFAISTTSTIKNFLIHRFVERGVLHWSSGLIHFYTTSLVVSQPTWSFTTLMCFQFGWAAQAHVWIFTRTFLECQIIQLECRFSTYFNSVSISAELSVIVSSEPKEISTNMRFIMGCLLFWSCFPIWWTIGWLVFSYSSFMTSVTSSSFFLELTEYGL